MDICIYIYIYIYIHIHVLLIFRLIRSLALLQQGRDKWCKHISFAKRSLLAGSSLASDVVRNATIWQNEYVMFKTFQDIYLCLKHFETHQFYSCPHNSTAVPHAHSNKTWCNRVNKFSGELWRYAYECNHWLTLSKQSHILSCVQALTRSLAHSFTPLNWTYPGSPYFISNYLDTRRDWTSLRLLALTRTRNSNLLH